MSLYEKKINIILNIMKLNDDNYIRPDKTEQDIISNSSKELKKRLEDFVKVPRKLIKELPLGVWIKYVSKEGKYRSGGILWKNEGPVYIILKNPGLNKTWSVNLSTNNIYIPNKEIGENKEAIKNKLYTLYKNGQISLDL